jgi:sugar/nucleoside kinase (ribokinase family)
LWTDGREVVRVAAAPVSTATDTTVTAGIDTTGAGDAFHAGFLAARVDGADAAAALAAGCRLAAEAVVTPGGRGPC